MSAPALDGFALDRIVSALDLIEDLESAAMLATMPDGDPQLTREARACLVLLLPDVPASTVGGYGSHTQVAAVRAVVGEEWPIPDAGVDLVRIPVLRSVLRQWAAAEWRRAEVLAA